MARDPLASRARTVLDNAAAGAYTLPEPITEVRKELALITTAHKRLHDAGPPRSPDGSALGAWLAGRPARKASNERSEDERLRDELLEFYEPQHAHQERIQRYGWAQEQLAGAIIDVEEQLVAAVGHARDEIVTEHLRPALDETITELRELAPHFAEPNSLVGLDYRLMDAEPERRKLYVRLLDADKRYDNIRHAQEALEALAGGPKGGGAPGLVPKFAAPPDLRAMRSGADLWFEIENFHELFGSDAEAPKRWQFRYQSAWTPWPSDCTRLQYRLWLAAGVARDTGVRPKVWVPLPAQQDEKLAVVVEQFFQPWAQFGAPGPSTEERQNLQASAPRRSPLDDTNFV